MATNGCDYGMRGTLPIEIESVVTIIVVRTVDPPTTGGSGGVKSDIQIAQEATLKPIIEVARDLGLGQDDIDLYGKYKAKIHLDVLDRLADKPDGKLILCTAITPTPAGEGKTTTNVGLSQGLAKLGKKVMTTLPVSYTHL